MYIKRFTEIHFEIRLTTGHLLKFYLKMNFVKPEINQINQPQKVKCATKLW